MAAKHKPTNIGELYETWVNGNRSDLRAAFRGLSALAAAALACDLLEYARGQGGRAAYLELSASIRRWDE